MSLSIKDKPHVEFCHALSDGRWKPWGSVVVAWVTKFSPTLDEVIVALREQPSWSVHVEKGLFVASRALDEHTTIDKFFFRCIDPFEQAVAVARFSQPHLHKP